VRATVPTSMQHIGELFQGFPVSVVPNLTQFDAASTVIRELSKWQLPSVSFGDDRIDPSPPSHIYSCDRNYSLPCPQGFVMLSGMDGWREAKCIAPMAYQGPCSGRATSFEGMSVEAKIRWSQMCGAVWPCIECTRNYSNVCPRGWQRTGDDLTCAPSTRYTGPCRAPVSFEGYNIKMLEEWSSACGAYLTCVAPRGLRVKDIMNEVVL